jgi:hypothetical protein
LKRRIWPTDNFGDFAHALNVAVAKLRTALCDSAQSPHLIETLHHHGYRFIAAIQFTAGAGGSRESGMDLRGAGEGETTPPAFGASQRPQGGPRLLQIAALTAGAAIVLLGTILIFRWPPLPTPRVAKIIQLFPFVWIHGEKLPRMARAFFSSSGKAITGISCRHQFLEGNRSPFPHRPITYASSTCRRASPNSLLHHSRRARPISKSLW